MPVLDRKILVTVQEGKPLGIKDRDGDRLRMLTVLIKEQDAHMLKHGQIMSLEAP